MSADKTGASITFDSLARQARVSRSWLYNQSDLHAEIERLRPDTTPTRRADRFPTGNAPPTPRFCGAWSPPPSASSGWRQKTSNSAKRWP